MSPRGIPGGGHRGQDGRERADRVIAARRQRGAAGELGDGGPVLLGHHDPGGEVVAVEQLVFAAQQVVLAVAPGRFGVGAVAGSVRRGPGEGFQVRPVHGQRGAGVLELPRDGCLEQVVAGRLQRPGGQPVGLVLAEGRGDQAEGPLGLPVGEQVRAVFPVRDHAEPPLLVLGQADQRLVHPGQVRGPVIGLGQAHAGQQGADAQLPGAHPGRAAVASIRGATPEASMISSNTASGIMAAGPPRAAVPRRPRRPAPARRSGRRAAGSS